jgi:hypothetical protein
MYVVIYIIIALRQRFRRKISAKPQNACDRHPINGIIRFHYADSTKTLANCTELETVAHFRCSVSDNKELKLSFRLAYTSDHSRPSFASSRHSSASQLHCFIRRLAFQAMERMFL